MTSRAVALVLVSCTQKRTAVDAGAGAGFDSPPTAAERVEALENRVLALEQRTLANENATFAVQMKVDNYEYASFTPASSGYARIDTSSGMFFVSLERLRPYANGYQADVAIGNPNFARYGDAKLNVTWGAPWDPKKMNYIDWEKTLRSTTVNVPTIIAGAWNTVHVVSTMALATSEETGAIRASLVTDQVFLAGHR